MGVGPITTCSLGARDRPLMTPPFPPFVAEGQSWEDWREASEAEIWMAVGGEAGWEVGKGKNNFNKKQKYK